MNILQLCCFTDLWHSKHSVTSIDLRNGMNVLDLSDDIGKEFDIVVAAPPCDQFTKAAAHCWQEYPEEFIKIAEKCYKICTGSNAIWWLENPPGRIEKFIPGLKQYRLITWQSSTSNKEYVIYGNTMVIVGHKERYARDRRKFNNSSKKQRERWEIELVKDLENSLIYV